MTHPYGDPDVELDLQLTITEALTDAETDRPDAQRCHVQLHDRRCARQLGHAGPHATPDLVRIAQDDTHLTIGPEGIEIDGIAELERLYAEDDDPVSAGKPAGEQDLDDAIFRAERYGEPYPGEVR